MNYIKRQIAIYNDEKEKLDLLSNEISKRIREKVEPIIRKYNSERTIENALLFTPHLFNSGDKFRASIHTTKTGTETLVSFSDMEFYLSAKDIKYPMVSEIREALNAKEDG